MFSFLRPTNKFRAVFLFLNLLFVAALVIRFGWNWQDDPYAVYFFALGIFPIVCLYFHKLKRIISGERADDTSDKIWQAIVMVMIVFSGIGLIVMAAIAFLIMVIRIVANL